MTTETGTYFLNTADTGEAASDPAIELVGVSKRFSARGPLVLDEVTLSIARGEFVCVLGASGSGKSTLLDVIAGLEQPTSGQVDTGSDRAAVMFQDAALLPWLSARSNIELALELAGTPRAERRGRALELLDVVGLGAADRKRPHELSGGMRHRVSLARALAQNRGILLLDEPFAALDAITRASLHDELERIWHDTGRTIVLVTHDIREATRLAQRIVLLAAEPGRVAREWSVPGEVRQNPTSDAGDRLRHDIAASLGSLARADSH